MDIDFEICRSANCRFLKNEPHVLDVRLRSFFKKPTIFDDAYSKTMEKIYE